MISSHDSRRNQVGIWHFHGLEQIYYFRMTHGRLTESVRCTGPKCPARVMVCNKLMVQTMDELMVIRMMNAMKAR